MDTIVTAPREHYRGEGITKTVTIQEIGDLESGKAVE
jgi:hypothetical protein